MGKHENIWNMVECTCRILGVSTATVLCGVGVETLQQGEFSSLGIYLLVTSVCIMIFELAYFLDTLLSVCLPCPPDWQLFLLWGKMAHVGGFHKFLSYSIMSVVCFLHPVLVWHAVIPGTMLLLTAFFNFILSKKTKVRPSKQPQESQSGNQGLSPTCATDGGALAQSSFSFLHSATGSRVGGLALALRDSGESVQAMLEAEQTAAPSDAGRERSRWRERRLMFSRRREQPVEREMEEMEEMERCSEPDADTTSDTAPMITD